MEGDPFFVVGPGRSGTTLLERRLRHHSRLFVSPETEFLFLLQQQGTLQRPFTPELASGFLRFYTRRRPARLLGLHEVEALESRLLNGAGSWRDVFCNLLGLIGEADGKPRYGEKTPHHLWCIDYILEAFPNARIIAMIRDGRAVVRSRLQHPRWEHNLLDASRHWAADARRIHALLTGEARERVLLVRYEQLVLEPQPVLAEVCGFLGERFEAEMLEADTTVPGRFQAYYRQPWMSRSLRGIDPARAGAWQDSYGPSELAVVEHELHRELALFGYPPMSDGSTPWRGLWAREWVRHQRYRAGRRLARMLPAAFEPGCNQESTAAR